MLDDKDLDTLMYGGKWTAAIMLVIFLVAMIAHLYFQQRTCIAHNGVFVRTFEGYVCISDHAVNYNDE